MDPLTISAGISALGGLFKGVTSLFGGNAEAKAQEAAADQAKREAGVASSVALQKGDAALAQAAIHGAAAGGGFAGSTLGVLRSLGQQSYFNARSAVYRGMQEAQSDLYQAKVSKAQGLSSLVGSAFGAVGTLAGGFAQSAAQAKQDQLLERLQAGGGLSATGAYGGGGDFSGG